MPDMRIIRNDIPRYAQGKLMCDEADIVIMQQSTRVGGGLISVCIIVVAKTKLAEQIAEKTGWEIVKSLGDYPCLDTKLDEVGVRRELAKHGYYAI